MADRQSVELLQVSTGRPYPVINSFKITDKLYTDIDRFPDSISPELVGAVLISPYNGDVYAHIDEWETKEHIKLKIYESGMLMIGFTVDRYSKLKPADEISQTLPWISELGLVHDSSLFLNFPSRFGGHLETCFFTKFVDGSKDGTVVTLKGQWDDVLRLHYLTFFLPGATKNGALDRDLGNSEHAAEERLVNEPPVAEEELPVAEDDPEEKYNEDPEKMRTAFDNFDANKDGTISSAEFGNLLRTLDADQWTDANVKDLFRAIDSDGSGCLDLDELVAWLHDVDAATKLKLMEKSVSRFTDFSHDPDGFTSALDGIFDDSMNPRVAFKQAVSAFPTDIKSETKKDVWLAQKFARSSKGKDAMAKYPGLDDQGAAAIYLYTAESPVYRILNKQLRSQERGTTQFRRHWYPFTRILIEALRVMSDASKTMLNRGVPMDLVKEYPEVYQKGETLIWWSFSSCTKEIEVLANDMFLGTTGPRTIFQILTSKGADISNFSAVQAEAECLLPPGLAIKIDSILPAGGGLTIIQCSDDEDAPDLLE